MRALGAIPEMVPTPRSRPKIIGSTPALPPAVDAVWVPWPSWSRGDAYSPSTTPNARSRPLENHRAPMSLLLQVLGGNSSPAWHLPCQYAGGGPYGSWVLSEKLGCSGQMPVSITPMMMFSPTVPASPLAHNPSGPLSPRSFGVLSVIGRRISSWLTDTTLGSCASRAASAGVSCAANP